MTSFPLPPRDHDKELEALCEHITVDDQVCDVETVFLSTFWGGGRGADTPRNFDIFPLFPCLPQIQEVNRYNLEAMQQMGGLVGFNGPPAVVPGAGPGGWGHEEVAALDLNHRDALGIVCGL